MTTGAVHLEVFAFASLETAVDTCPERMYVVDAEASGPLRIETGVEFCSGVAWMQAMMGLSLEAEVDACLEGMYAGLGKLPICFL